MSVFLLLCTTAVLSNPDDQTSGVTLLQIFLGLIFLFFILFYVSGHSNDDSSSTEKPDTEKVISKAGSPVMEKKEEGEENSEGVQHNPPNGEGETESQEEQLPDVTLATALFHLLMFFASMYYSMIVSNWGSPNHSDDNYTEFSKEWLGCGMKIASQWIATLLFIWSLIAPCVCPNRDFS